MLVLAPTRELASQIAESFAPMASTCACRSSTRVRRRADQPPDPRSLPRGVDVLVATPGRLLDLIDQRALTLRDVEILVLDEADQMLDLGFIHALKRIDQLVPKKRQTLFFSATMPKTIADLGDSFLTNPVKVSVAPPSTTAERVEQYVIFVNQAEKQALLTLTLQARADRARAGLHPHQAWRRPRREASRPPPASPPTRSTATRASRSANARWPRSSRADAPILVATDIAARGIDVSGVSHVFNFELPNVPEQYVHRIGRTARAGATGIAISFVADDERAYLRDIEKLTRVQLRRSCRCPRISWPSRRSCPSRPGPTSAPSARTASVMARASAATAAAVRTAVRGGERPAGGAPKRRFGPRKGAPGQHRNAVKRTGGAAANVAWIALPLPCQTATPALARQGTGGHATARPCRSIPSTLPSN